MSRAITDTLRDVRRGAFVDEATEALAKIVNAVLETGKPGELTIKLGVKVASRGAGAVIVTDKLAMKLPVGSPDETMMFGTPEGSLVADDPKQKKLDLKVAPDPSAAPLKVAEQ